MHQCDLLRRISGTRKSIRAILAQRRQCYRHLQGTQCWHAKLQFITTYVTWRGKNNTASQVKERSRCVISPYFSQLRAACQGYISLQTILLCPAAGNNRLCLWRSLVCGSPTNSGALYFSLPFSLSHSLTHTDTHTHTHTPLRAHVCNIRPNTKQVFFL